MAYYLEFFTPSVKSKHLGIKIACQIGREKSLLKTDRSKIDAALSNLLSNAIKFTAKGRIEFGNYIEGDSLVFFVKDTGIGIAQDQMEAVFDRFVQADLNMTKPYQGTGLGLSIIKGYIHLLNGKIWVESEERKGSVFYFSIPYSSLNT
jgi:signal transduction histidine kinase